MPLPPGALEKPRAIAHTDRHSEHRAVDDTYEMLGELFCLAFAVFVNHL
jgi:hypothetical protein